MELLSFVLEGQLGHRDSMGNGSVIVPGLGAVLECGLRCGQRLPDQLASVGGESVPQKSIRSFRASPAGSVLALAPGNGSTRATGLPR
jgi:hypothetical protein